MIRRHPIRATLIGLPLVLMLELRHRWSRSGSPGFRSPARRPPRWFTLTKTANADYTPSPTGPVFLLAIGNDGRPGDTVTRGDAIHLIGVNPALHQATILDIPRDTGMQIPGHGIDKVNASHAFGGPRLQADTIGAAVGVTIPYVIDTDFDGFIGMVDDLGGLTVNVPIRMQDKFSGADFQPGPQKLDGHQALAYARNRHQFPNRRPRPIREPGLPHHPGPRAVPRREHRTDRDPRACSPTSAATPSSTASGSRTSTRSAGSDSRSIRQR